MKESTKPINKRIATYRKLAGYTQQAAADALGMKKSTYARIELHGNPTSDLLMKLSRLYNVEPMLLLFGVKTEPQENTGLMRLHDDNSVYFPRQMTDITLTVNERNCIKACRKLTKEQRSEIMALINKYYALVSNKDDGDPE